MEEALTLIEEFADAQEPSMSPKSIERINTQATKLYRDAASAFHGMMAETSGWSANWDAVPAAWPTVERVNVMHLRSAEP